MLSDAALRELLVSGESDHVERTARLRDLSKIGEAICAFANDLADRRQPGVIFVGVTDAGACAGLEIDERVLQTLMGFRTDGNILPQPVMSVRRAVLDGCAMAVVEVAPSDSPPVKCDGRVCVRVGPRRGYATPEEERRLTERRRWGALSFDQQPVAGAELGDLDLLRFQEEYLPALIAPDVLAENGREIADQLRALGLTWRDGTPTVLGLLVCGRNPRAWLPGAYVQFVRYPGTEIGDLVQSHREIGGPLVPLLRQLDEVIEANVRHGADLTGPVERARDDYPVLALQELVRNAVIHRNYEMTSAPVRLTWFADRVEILSPGGPYGAVTEATLGQEGNLTDARNPALAVAAKALGFVQRFGSGIPRARRALERNGNPPPEFRAEANFIHVTVRAAP